MTRYISFLRGINVSGQKLIKMEELRRHFEIPGINNVVTYIQSGNVLFDTRITDEIKLRKTIEKQLVTKLGYTVPTLLRSLDEIRNVVQSNPFEHIPVDGPRKLYVTFLSDTIGEAERSKLDPFKTEGEEYRIIGREVYLLLGGYGNTKLSNTLIEKKLGVQATTRNWATVNKILEL